MKYLVMVFLVMFLASFFVGCKCQTTKDLTNEDIVNQTKFCNESGLNAYPVYDRHHRRIVDIQCIPKEAAP